MIGEGMPWALLLPIAMLVFLAGINAGKKSRDQYIIQSQTPEDESFNHK